MSSFDSRGYQENTGRVSLGKLMREGKDNQEVYASLSDAYPNDREAVNKMMAQYEEQMGRIRRKAQKFAQLILTRYSHLGPKRILEKARKYKKKYNFSDDEFQAFINVAFNDKTFSQGNIYNLPNTPMAGLLGHSEQSLGKMNVKANEIDVLQDILKIHQENQELHKQVILQSLTYNTCDAIAITGDYDQKRDNAYSFVDPVIAALFLPKVTLFDTHMIIASITSIVATRYKGLQLKSYPDYQLYYDIITDPNEVACQGNKESSLVDLQNRAKLQVELWKQVRSLRQGRYYNADSSAFSMALENCRNNFFDTPDLAYVRDEGTVIRRLFNAFSLRPTWVSVAGYQQATGSTLGAGISAGYPVSSLAMTQITNIPIINVRLPLSFSAGSTTASTGLFENLSQVDWYVENKVIVPKTKQVLFTRDVLVFYVNRRFQNLNYERITNPYQISYQALPSAISGYDKVNKTPVEYDPTGKNVGTDTASSSLKLQSVVAIDTMVLPDTISSIVTAGTTVGGPTKPEPKEIIIGSTALINSCSGKDMVAYHPHRVTQLETYGRDGVALSTKNKYAPIGKIEDTKSSLSELGLQDLIKQYGTIFIYTKA